MFSASKTAGPSGYNINNSLRFRSSASAYLNRTPASAGNRQIWTISVWVKRGTLGIDQKICSAYSADSDSGIFDLRFTAGNVLYFGYWTSAQETAAVYRDPSAWYHIVVAVDSTQATASNRVKMYVNGTQVTVSGAAFAQNTQLAWNNNVAQNIGRQARTSDGYFDGYLAEFNSIDGQALTPSSFGSTNATTGVWQPAKYTGSYGTNGFYLPFSDIGLTSGSNTGLGKDFSGNGNYFNTNNISVTSGTTYDAMTDSPTNTSATVANYAVFDVTIPHRNFPVDGNLKWTGSASNPGSAPWGLGCQVNFPMSSGKWYWEVTKLGGTSNLIGILDTAVAYTGNGSEGGADGTVYSYYYLTGGGSWFSTTFNPSFAASYATNDVIGVAFDADNNKLYFAKNGTWQASGDPSAGTNGVSVINQSGSWVPMMSSGSYTSNSYAFNGGQRPFAYTPPSGFNRLNTFNLPTSTIVKGNTVMDATLYTGNSSTQTITNAGAFKPDLVWLKCRSTAGTWNNLVDSVRGASKTLYSNTTNAEGTDNYLSAFNSNGFGLNVGDSGTNTSGNTYVAWQWQAGQGSTSSNTSGSITSTVSVNTTAGFSIVTYTGNGAIGATVGHGLGVAPSMIILKRRTGSTASWLVWHRSLSNLNNNYLLLDTTNAQLSSTNIWGTQTSSVIALDTDSLVNEQNANGSTYVAYCWAEIAGFSRFGSYTGNGSTDGPFVFLGFRPEFLMIKVTSTTEQWAIKDATRVPYNTNNTQLFANAADAEDTNNTFHMIDFLSNGFKMRGAAQNLVNGNGQNYIYMAFAENPFKNALAR